MRVQLYGGKTTKIKAYPVTKAKYVSLSNGETVEDVLLGISKDYQEHVTTGKKLIANAITEKGVETSPTASFDLMANNIKQIQTGGGDVSAIVKTASEMHNSLMLGTKESKIASLRIRNVSTADVGDMIRYPWGAPQYYVFPIKICNGYDSKDDRYSETSITIKTQSTIVSSIEDPDVYDEIFQNEDGSFSISRKIQYNSGGYCEDSYYTLPTPIYNAKAVNDNDGNIFIVGLDDSYPAKIKVFFYTFNRNTGRATLEERGTYTPTVNTTEPLDAIIINNEIFIYHRGTDLLIKFDTELNTFEISDIPSYLGNIFYYDNKIITIRDYAQNDVNVVIYDLQSKTTTNGSSPLFPLQDSAKVIYNNKIYSMGGSYSDNSEGGNNVVQIYDIDTDTWEYGPIMPSKLKSAVAAVNPITGKIYCIGGFIPINYINNESNVSNFFCLNTNTNKWLTETNSSRTLRTPHGQPAMGFDNLSGYNRFLIFGGNDNTSQPTSSLVDSYRYGVCQLLNEPKITDAIVEGITDNDLMVSDFVTIFKSNFSENPNNNDLIEFTVESEFYK